ncbi:MAG: hypothetical protein U5O16_03060 [Rhodococcus sp. (in: high G+C Gram-positive bacteria)]|uniref:hypothetical protein n=1 Tax=Rhodococcus sp. TaxID=1831 RepID=UPI002AD76F6C|nr:hypothetical protein [Rhodococcus sp. (in: high G+C Gram-positive bacteria)]
MKAQRQPGEAAVPVKDFLASRLAVSQPGVKAALNLDPKWRPDSGGVVSDPAVVVFDDSGPLDWPVSSTHQIRVTVWSNSRTRSRAIAKQCLGWLLCIKVPGISHVSPGSNLIDDLDPDNEGRMASFTVNAKVRTVSL